MPLKRDRRSYASASTRPADATAPVDPLVDLHRELVEVVAGYKAAATDEAADALWERRSQLDQLAKAVVPTTMDGAIAAIAWARQEHVEFHLSSGGDPRDHLVVSLLDGALGVLRRMATETVADHQSARELSQVVQQETITPDRRHPVRVREGLLRPAPTGSRAPRPKTPPQERARVIDDIRRSLDSRRLGFEIQQTCGAVALRNDQDESFSALRKMAQRHARNFPAELTPWLVPAAAERAAAYSSLVKRLPCSHCAARDVCPAAHARRVN